MKECEEECRIFLRLEETRWQEIAVYGINPFGTREDPNFFETLTAAGPLFLDWYEHWPNAGLRFSAPDA